MASIVRLFVCFSPVVAMRVATADSSDDLKVAPCRPTVTCTADIAPPGTIELEVGYQLRRVDDGAVYEHGTPILAKLPLATWLEVQLGDNGLTITPTARYVDNVVAGVKLHALDQSSSLPSLAVTIAASVPTVAQRGYVRMADLFATAHASKDAGKLHVDANAGLYAWQLAGPVASQPFAAVAASYAATARVTVTVEPHYFADAMPVAPRDVGAIGAVAYALRPWLVIDGAADVVLAAQGSVSVLAWVSIAPAQVPW